MKKSEKQLIASLAKQGYSAKDIRDKYNPNCTDQTIKKYVEANRKEF